MDFINKRFSPSSAALESTADFFLTVIVKFSDCSQTFHTQILTVPSTNVIMQKVDETVYI